MKSRAEHTVERLAPPQTASLPHEVMALLPDQWPNELPLARVTTCGPSVSIAVLHQLTPTPAYGLPDPAVLEGGYASTAQLLLAVLASRPHGAASKDWLSEALITRRSVLAQGDDPDERVPLQRVENPVSVLRHLLVPPLLRALPTLAKLRLHRVSFYRSTRESGCGYRLAGMPLIWVDVVAIEESIKRAHALEQFGSDAQREWEAAYALLMQGEFVERELYSDWAVWRRQEQERQRWECVHALQGYYRKQGESGEREATRILQRYWQSHMSHEDAFRPLVELLGKQEGFGQAEEAYAHLCQALEEEGKEPDRRTQEVMTWLRALQIQRTPSQQQSASPRAREDNIIPYRPKEVKTEEPVPSPEQSESGMTALFDTFPEVDISALPLPFQLPSFEAESERDWTAHFGLKQAHLTNVVYQWVGRASSYEELQMHVHTALKAFESETSLLSGDLSQSYQLSRRQALLGLASLAATFVASRARNLPSFTYAEEFLPQCAAGILACRQLMKGKDFFPVASLLTEYLKALAPLLHTSSPYQSVAAHLATQCYILAGIVATHRLKWEEAENQYLRAVNASRLTTNLGLQVTVSIQLATNRFYSQKQPERALQNYQEALPLLKKSSRLTQSNFSVKQAAVYAQNRQRAEAKKSLTLAHTSFPEDPEQDASFLYADFGASSLLLWEGLMFLELARHNLVSSKEAWEKLALGEQLHPTKFHSERNRLEIMNYQTQASVLLGDMEQFRAYLLKGLEGANRLGSARRRQEVVDAYWMARHKWPKEPKVIELAEHFLPHD